MRGGGKPHTESELSNLAAMSNTWPRSVMQAGKQKSAREQPCTRSRPGGPGREGRRPSRPPRSYPGNRTCARRGRRGRARRRPPARLRRSGPPAGDYRPARADGFTSGDLSPPRRAPRSRLRCEGLPRPAGLTRRAHGGAGGRSGPSRGCKVTAGSRRKSGGQRRRLPFPPPPLPPYRRQGARTPSGAALKCEPGGPQPGLRIPPLPAGPGSRAPPPLPSLPPSLGRALTRRRAGSRGWHPAAGWASPHGAPLPCRQAKPSQAARRRRGRRT